MLQMRSLFVGLIFSAALWFCAGCATASKISPEVSEQMRQMAEMRDTCTQYAAWVARDYAPTSPEFKEAQRLYIEASAAANSYIEALQFDVLAGGTITADQYEKAAIRVHDSGEKFLNYAREAVGVNKTRFLPLLIPLAGSLIKMGTDLNDMVKAANQQQRNLIAQSISEKKWKPFNELTR
jgi:hypothetical protein